MKREPIKTVAPSKGGLVKGHKVYAFLGGDLPAVPGVISETNKSGLTVTLDVGPVLGRLGLRRRTKWTWRNKAGVYQQKGARAANGCGLALITNPRS